MPPLYKFDLCAKHVGFSRLGPVTDALGSENVSVVLYVVQLTLFPPFSTIYAQHLLVVAATCRQSAARDQHILRKENVKTIHHVYPRPRGGEVEINAGSLDSATLAILLTLVGVSMYEMHARRNQAFGIMRPLQVIRFTTPCISLNPCLS